MGIVINTNIASLTAQRALNTNTGLLNKSLERLSTGYRINRAGDDAAGLQISEKLRAQIRGSRKALDNVQDGINVLNITDGALTSIGDLIQRMRELVVQGASDTLGADQRNAIESELDQLASEIDRVSNATQFNGRNLLDGSITSSGGTYKIQVGPNNTATQNTIDISSAFNNVDVASMVIDDANILVTDNANALSSLSRLDAALQSLNIRRSTLGAYMFRLEAAADNLQIGIENQSSAESRIRNTDIARESAELVKNQILQQSAATVLSQANQAPSIAIQLLQGSSR